MTPFTLLPDWYHRNHTRRNPDGDTPPGPCSCPAWAKQADTTDPTIEHCRCCGACQPTQEHT